MSLCKRLVGGPKSVEELWHLVKEIEGNRRKTAGDITVRKEDKFLQIFRDETMYVKRGYDSGVEFAFKLEKTAGLLAGRPKFSLFASVEENWQEVSQISADMRPGSNIRDFDLWNYSLLLMLSCEK